MLLAADDTDVPEMNVIVTVAAPAPNAKLFPVVVIMPPAAVIRFVPVRAPTIETPNPGDVIVDDDSVRPVEEADPA